MAKLQDRRTVLSGVLAAAAAGPALFVRAARADLPALKGVDFVKGASPRGRRLSGAFNLFTRKLPEVRAECRSADGVAHAVRWARDSGQAFAVHSTGHCFAGHSMHERLVIGTSSLKHIRPDPGNNLVTVGPGAFTGNVYLTLAGTRHALGGGSYASVGMAGLTLGGGVGFRSRKAGLLCDQLESLSLVDATGRLVTASETENPDLFWACRGGGGGSLGIVTEMTFRTEQAPQRSAIHVFIAVKRQEAERILYDWQHWSKTQDRGTTTHLYVIRRGAQDYLIGLTGEAEGHRKDVFSRLRDLLGADRTIHENGVTDYYSERGLNLVKNADDVIEPFPILSKSEFVARALPGEGIRTILDAMERIKPGQVKLTMEALGGAVDDVAPDATAYPHRGAAYLVELRADPPDIFGLPEYRRAIDTVKEAYVPYATGGVYVNYPYPTLEKWAQAYWGRNLPRLMDIKRKWDPDNVFRHAQSVPLEADR